MLECVLHLFLCQHVYFPTRVGNILDLNLSTEQNMLNIVEVVVPLWSSHHNAIEFSVITQVQVKESKESILDFQASRRYFSAIEWHEILDGKS